LSLIILHPLRFALEHGLPLGPELTVGQDISVGKPTDPVLTGYDEGQLDHAPVEGNRTVVIAGVPKASQLFDDGWGIIRY